MNPNEVAAYAALDDATEEWNRVWRIRPRNFMALNRAADALTEALAQCLSFPDPVDRGPDAAYDEAAEDYRVATVALDKATAEWSRATMNVTEARTRMLMTRWRER